MFGTICATIVQPLFRVEHQKLITLTKAFRHASTLLLRKTRLSSAWILLADSSLWFSIEPVGASLMHMPEDNGGSAHSRCFSRPIYDDQTARPAFFEFGVIIR
jgi:hypothetical protein